MRARTGSPSGRGPGKHARHGDGRRIGEKRSPGPSGPGLLYLGAGATAKAREAAWLPRLCVGGYSKFIPRISSTEFPPSVQKLISSPFFFFSGLAFIGSSVLLPGAVAASLTPQCHRTKSLYPTSLCSFLPPHPPLEPVFSISAALYVRILHAIPSAASHAPTQGLFD
jgi:hypothetical protein